MSKIFNDAFAKFTNLNSVIPFNPLWANGTGYFNHAVDGQHAPVLAEGQVVVSEQTCEGYASRRLILIGTMFGNVVLFDRYNDENSVIVYNIPSAVQDIYMGSICSGAQTEEQLYVLLGGVGCGNVGKRLSRWTEAYASRRAALAVGV